MVYYIDALFITSIHLLILIAPYYFVLCMNELRMAPLRKIRAICSKWIVVLKKGGKGSPVQIELIS